MLPDSSLQPIVQVHSQDYGGGAEAVARLHHLELLRQGHPCRLFVARKLGQDPGVEQIAYVRGPPGSRRLARWFERRTGRQYVYAPSFKALLAGLPEQAGLAHLHSLHGLESYADIRPLVALSRRIPVVLTLHDLWLLTGHCAYPLDCPRWLSGCGQCPDLERYPALPRDGTRANWHRKLSIFAQVRAHLIVPSQWVAEQVAQSPILRHLPVTVVHNPVDTRIFCPGERLLARQRLGLPPHRRILLITAQHWSNPYKGIREGLAVINQLTDPQLYVVAIGTDAEALLSQCRVPGRAVDYQEQQSALVDFYRAADLFLMPSRCETFGMVAAEAMACGTPVVAFAAGGVPDVLGADEGGRLIPPGDVAGMAEAVTRLLEEDEGRAALGVCAAARAAREFSLATHTHGCLKVYEEARRAHEARRN